MRVSFQQRRQGILADCRQHKTDVTSYSENNRFKASLFFDYDFNTDLQETELPTKYPDDREEE